MKKKMKFEVEDVSKPLIKQFMNDSEQVGLVFTRLMTRSVPKEIINLNIPLLKFIVNPIKL